MSEFLVARIGAVTAETHLVKRFELLPMGDARLPVFTAGSHVDLYLPNGLIRSYSLLNSPRELNRYELGIALDRHGRGGSRLCHEQLHSGDTIKVSMPSNAFPLVETDAPVLLIGGGIGVTPLISMAHELHGANRPWRLIYAAGSRADFAFLDVLRTFGDRVSLHADDECGQVPDIRGMIASAAPQTHFYGCGPAPMLDAFRRAVAHLPPQYAHMESFSAEEPPARVGGFVVKLAKSGITLEIPAGVSILEACKRAGIPVASSCEQGVCGTCETRVISGVPDHRDMVLSEQERASHSTMMICCSGAKSDCLILDL